MNNSLQYVACRTSFEKSIMKRTKSLNSLNLNHYPFHFYFNLNHNPFHPYFNLNPLHLHFNHNPTNLFILNPNQDPNPPNLILQYLNPHPYIDLVLNPLNLTLHHRNLKLNLDYDPNPSNLTLHHFKLNLKLDLHLVILVVKKIYQKFQYSQKGMGLINTNK
uniref:Uncharacterized protein LOC105851156 n=1 Tax=Cicer arietinum TaxID=3827 RepID=A0A3Q7YBZ6_CICAR|nr:uncharacterized protein LOC105851156 [Cicer arietinum]